MKKSITPERLREIKAHLHKQVDSLHADYIDRYSGANPDLINLFQLDNAARFLLDAGMYRTVNTLTTTIAYFTDADNEFPPDYISDAVCEISAMLDFLAKAKDFTN